MKKIFTQSIVILSIMISFSTFSNELNENINENINKTLEKNIEIQFEEMNNVLNEQLNVEFDKIEKTDSETRMSNGFKHKVINKKVI